MKKVKTNHQAETTKESNLKIYQLAEDEVQNLKGREKFAGYILDLVERDVAVYMTQVIFKRLNLPMDTKAKISEDSKQLIVDDSPKIIIP